MKNYCKDRTCYGGGGYKFCFNVRSTDDLNEFIFQVQKIGIKYKSYGFILDNMEKVDSYITYLKEYKGLDNQFFYDYWIPMLLKNNLNVTYVSIPNWVLTPNNERRIK
jgi:hypothetical protein